MEMEWARGATVGRGSFSTVNLAFSKNCRQVMAVKSTPLFKSSLLQRERSILDDLQGCPQIVRCFGDSITAENGGVDTLFNVFLEYLPRGTLYDLLCLCGGSLAEAAVRCYTRSLLQGLRYIHAQGYVHCDVKLQNILVCSDKAVKIADFGLAKKAGQRVLDDGSVHCLRGTPIYMAPESVARSEYEAPADIWSVGCAVAEMVSGKPAWSCSDDRDAWALLLRIGFGDEMPEIPLELSDEGKDFLGKCFVRDPMKRWTAEMLLNHPFLASQDDDRIEDDAKDFMTPQSLLDAKCMDEHLSPRSVFDLARSFSVGSSFTSITWASSMETSAVDCPVPALVVDRLQCLETGSPPDWSCSSLDDGWITVRNYQSNPKSEETKETNSRNGHDPLLILENMMCREENRGENPCCCFDGEASCATSQHVLPMSNWSRKESISNSEIVMEVRACSGIKDEESFCEGGGDSDGTCHINIGWLEASCFISSRSQECIDLSISNEYKHRHFCC